MSAVVAIVGRPNVGKSTLFNRIIGKRRSIESPIAGTTRDRIYEQVSIDGYSVFLVDTGGLELAESGTDIEDNVQDQAKLAIREADVILFVVDIRSDLTADDFHAAQLLRKSKKPVLLIANKCDNPEFAEQRYSLYELGFDEPIPVTALHSSGLDLIEDRLTSTLKSLKFKRGKVKVEEGDEAVRIAFLGRPNVGKSTMVNAILGEKRLVTSDIPGTTRDTTEIPFTYDDQDFILIDTAGLRRRGKIEKGIEKYSVLRTLQAVELADICVLLLDMEEGVTSQDCHVTEYVLDQKTALILAVNKIDKFPGELKEDKENRMIYALRSKMAYIPWAPVVFSSGLKSKNIFKILDLAKQVAAERKKEIPEQDLKLWLMETLKKFPPKGTRGKRRFSVLSVKQESSNPPHFIFYCNWPEIMHFSYGRYLENELRDRFGFVGTSVKFTFKKPGE